MEPLGREDANYGAVHLTVVSGRTVAREKTSQELVSPVAGYSILSSAG